MTVEARFDRVTRAGHIFLVCMALMLVAAAVAFFFIDQAPMTYVASAMFFVGSAYGFYRPSHLAYAANASPDGIRAKPFVGPTVSIAWQHVTEVQRWRAPSQLARTEHLRLVSSAGRSVTVTSRMFGKTPSNEGLDAFVDMVERNALEARKTRPSRIIRLPVG